MRLSTKYFGDIEFEPDRVITFPSGLPGFPDERRFLLLEGDEPDGLFRWLQCVDDGDIAFTLMDLYQVMPQYNPLVEPDEVADLGDLTGTPLEIYNIAVIPDDVRQMRVNLQAPVVINPVAMRGKQVIVSNGEYNIRHYIFKELERMQTAAAKGGA